MSSPLGPALANIFAGYLEEKFFSKITKAAVYFRYVDDIFVLYQNEKESEKYVIKFNEYILFSNSLPRKDKNKCLPFLRLCVEYTTTSCETRVYRKPTLTGQYLRWESFTQTKRKTSIISIYALSTN